jgi:hypothetical protein
MAAGYLPSNDSQFSDWVDQFLAYLTPNILKFGLTLIDLDPIEAAHPDWDTSLSTYSAMRAAALGARTSKDDKREVLTEAIRELVNRIQVAPGTTDDDREQLGIPVRGASAIPSDLETSNERPAPIIDISSKLRHVLRIQNETPTGRSNAKPAGALGAEIWRKVGAEPVGDGDLEYVGLATRSPYAVEYVAEEGGKTAYYKLRWVGSGQEKGAWSETEAATIAA